MIIGLTGGLATGKTTVAGIFAKLGAYVIDADKIVHRILDKSARRRLSGFVFDDKEALRRLCRAIHPLVKKEIIRKADKYKKNHAVIIDAPLLIESSLHKRCDYIVVVKTTLKKQLERAEKKLSISGARKRIAFQMPLREKIALADFVIDNGGSLKDTEKQVRRVWKDLTVSKVN